MKAGIRRGLGFCDCKRQDRRLQKVLLISNPRPAIPPFFPNPRLRSAIRQSAILIKPRPILLSFLFVSVFTSPLARGEDPAVSIADLAGYRAALGSKVNSTAATPVTFRELWDHPRAYQGRLVQVEGRVARLFRQASVGKFPPLAEAWITSPVGDPTCLIFPTDSGQATPTPGDRVRFVGTFLRRITYKGSDTDRVAPLVVGPRPPSVLDPASGASGEGGSIFGDTLLGDWGIGLAATLGVLWVLLRRHLSRPSALDAPVGPPPTFLDGDDDDDEESVDEGDLFDPPPGAHPFGADHHVDR